MWRLSPHDRLWVFTRRGPRWLVTQTIRPQWPDTDHGPMGVPLQGAIAMLESGRIRPA